MTTTAPQRATPRPPAPAPAPAPEPSRDVVAVVGSGVAVLVAAAPVAAVVQGAGWFGHAAAVVALVTAIGLLPTRVPATGVAVLQLAGMLGLLTVEFTAGLLPGPAALGELGRLVAGAGAQIESGVAPVPATPEIVLLVTAALGLVAVAVQALAVAARAPAAAGVPLLIVFAVPTAVSDALLPWWALVAAALAYGIVLVAGSGAGRRLPGGAALVAGAAALGLLTGLVTPMIGTTGRLEPGTAVGAGSGGTIGLSPFAALRGQLRQNASADLFEVHGLPEPAYLRALTLRDYVPEVGWQAGRPDPGVALPGPIPVEAEVRGAAATVEITNVGFRDYWLPVYGVPTRIDDVAPDAWAFDAASGIGYTSRPQREEGWVQAGVLPAPSADALLSATGESTLPPAYLSVQGVDPRVGDIAAEVTADASTDFGRALALNEYFAGAGSTFRYSLQTAAGAGDDALVEFLTAGRAGYCEQFASAMAVMLRTVGVPARVAVGFTAGTDEGGVRTVGTDDAHAWVEAWFPGHGWLTFDPTPLDDGRAIVPTYVQEAREAAATAPGGPDPESGPLGAPPSPESARAPDPGQAAPDAAVPDGAGNSGFPLWPLAVLAVLAVVALACLVPAGLRERERRARLAAADAGGPAGATAAWAELLAESTDRGVPGRSSDTVRGAARRLVREHRLDEDAQQALRRVVVALEAAWYGQGGTDPGTLGADARAIAAGIAAGSPLRLRDRLLPRSVLAKAGPRRRSALGDDDAATIRT